MTDSRVDATTDPADAASVSPPAGRPARPAGPEPRRRPAWTVPDWRDRDHQAYGLLLVMLAGAVGLLVYLAHDLWFVWGDDYDFFLLRGTVPVLSCISGAPPWPSRRSCPSIRARRCGR